MSAHAEKGKTVSAQSREWKRRVVTQIMGPRERMETRRQQWDLSYAVDEVVVGARQQHRRIRMKNRVFKKRNEEMNEWFEKIT